MLKIKYILKLTIKPLSILVCDILFIKILFELVFAIKLLRNCTEINQTTYSMDTEALYFDSYPVDG